MPGRREANPLMAGLADRPAAFWAVKLGAAGFAHWGIGRAACRDPGAALGLSVLLNAVYGAVVVRNAAALRGP